MHAVLATLGTAGDVFPYVGLGARLRSRGHRVTLVANEEFGPLAADHGLGFRALVSTAEVNVLLHNPAFWHSVKGPPLAARWGLRFLGRQYALLAELTADGDAVLAASPGVLAARLMQERCSRPMASVVLQPWMIPSTTAPPIMPGGMTLPRGAPRWVGDLYWRLLDVVGRLLLGSRLNRLRASLGLKPARRIFQWWISPERVIGLFPEWYGQPQADWPPQVRLAGFPAFDGGRAHDLPPDVREFCGAGPTVAFTFGTGMMHAERLFRAAVGACRRLGVRGLLLTRHTGQLPDVLPPFMRHCEFASFQQLFPLCAAAVHHGGVGTVARALATGTPQLILPWAFDQEDNARRVKQLGAGDWLRPGQRNASQIADVLERLLTVEARVPCRELAARFGGDGLDAAAGYIEELARRQ